MKDFWRAEPTLILAFVQAALACGMGFGLPITPQQMALILTLSGTLLALINRAQVTSPATLQAMTPKALAAAQDTAEPVKDVVKKLPVVLLACLLAGASMACGGARHIAVVADATFAQAVFAVDDAEYKACQTHVPPFTVEVCTAADPKIKQALLDVKAVTQALIVSPKSGTLPKDFPSLIKNLTEVQAMISPLSPSVVKADVAAKIQQALAQAVAILSAFAGVK